MLRLRGLARPQYLWRPKRLARRIAHELRSLKEIETVQLPWGIPIEVNTTDAIGRAIARQGLYDVVTMELLWRLAQPGETALDVGANIGFFTGLLSARLGAAGSVHSWEPHPQTFRQLQKNVERWRGFTTLAKIDVSNVALSDTEGIASLTISEKEKLNLGYSYLSSQPLAGSVSVRTELLFSFLESVGSVGVMKLDVEGHEARVLAGAGEHLRAGKIRDIVFEEQNPFPSASHEMLMSAGYEVFWFEEHLRGLKVISPASPPRRRQYDLPPSFAATRDPARLERLLSSLGWQSF